MFFGPRETHRGKIVVRVVPIISIYTLYVNILLFAYKDIYIMPCTFTPAQATLHKAFLGGIKIAGSGFVLERDH